MGSQNTPYRFMNAAKIVFKAEFDQVATTRSQLLWVEAVLRDVLEFCFALQYSDAKGSYNWKQLSEDLEDMEKAKIRTDAHADGVSDGMSQAAASASAGMQLG